MADDLQETIEIRHEIYNTEWDLVDQYVEWVLTTNKIK